jgi:hypothetical protein
MAWPLTELDPRYSDPAAQALPWSIGRENLATAPLYWLSTVRPDGRPHVTPLLAVWLGDLAYLCTGAAERKALNLWDNRYCVLSTGTNALDSGLDITIEAEATRLRDDQTLQEVAAAYLDKYGTDWTFQVRNGKFVHADGVNEAVVFQLTPCVGFGFGKDPYSQTRWRF